MKKIQTGLTYHGSERLDSRCSLSLEDIDSRIHSGTALYFGLEAGSRREHWVIWSEADQQAIEIVRDWLTGSLVTILWDHFDGKQKVPEYFVNMAKILSTFPGLCSLDDINLSSLKAKYPELEMKITAIIRPNILGGIALLRNVDIKLGKLNLLNRPWEDPLFLLKIKSLWRKHPKTENMILHQVIIRLGESEAVKSVILRKKLHHPTTV